VISDKAEHDVVAEILIELGTLLKMRIDSYLTHNYEGVQANFFNEFIICPGDYVTDGMTDCFKEFVRSPMLKLKDFNSKLAISRFHAELTNLSLTKMGTISYGFDIIFPSEGQEYDQDDRFYLTLNGSEIDIDKDNLEIINWGDKETLERLLGDVKLEIYR
jgi:hypothetical protein